MISSDKVGASGRHTSEENDKVHEVHQEMVSQQTAKQPLLDFVFADISDNKTEITMQPAGLHLTPRSLMAQWRRKRGKTQASSVDLWGFHPRIPLAFFLLVIFITQVIWYRLKSVVMSLLVARLFHATVMVQTHVTLALEPWTGSKPKRHVLESHSEGDGTVRVKKVFVQRVLNTESKLVSAEVTGAVEGGLVSAVNTVSLKWAEDSASLPKTLVLKTIPATIAFRSTSLLQRQNREAKFYNWAGKSPLLQRHCPQIYHAGHSDISGDFVIVMENMSDRSFTVSKLMGNQCWGPCAEIPDKYSHMDAQLLVLETIVQRAADIHASHWRDRTLFSEPWLKNSDHLLGKGRARFECGLIAIRKGWQKVKSHSIAVACSESKSAGIKANTLADDGSAGIFSSLMVRTMKNALNNSSWYAFRQRLDIDREDVPFTLVHGDFHGANMLWKENTMDSEQGGNLMLLDWSEVGIFCPFTEVAQLMISNATIDFRRKYERRLFDLYYDRLISCGVDATVFTKDMCWERYVLGGIEKWLQFMVILSAISLSNPSGLPWSAIRWFHDQVEAFVKDHLQGVKRSLCFMSSFPMANQLL